MSGARCDPDAVELAALITMAVSHARHDRRSAALHAVTTVAARGPDAVAELVAVAAAGLAPSVLGEVLVALLYVAAADERAPAAAEAVTNGQRDVPLQPVLERLAFDHHVRPGRHRRRPADVPLLDGPRRDPLPPSDVEQRAPAAAVPPRPPAHHTSPPKPGRLPGEG